APSTRRCLSPREAAGKNGLRGGIARPGIEPLEARHLRSGKAALGLRSLAQEYGRVKLASCGIVDNPILDAVVCVTGGPHSGFNGRELRCWNGLLRIAQHLCFLRSVGQQLRPIVRRRSRKNAVVIGGISLSFHQRLAPAVRTRAEIGMAGWVAIEACDQRLG